jgi:hypothetical protein
MKFIEINENLENKARLYKQRVEEISNEKE